MGGSTSLCTFDTRQELSSYAQDDGTKNVAQIDFLRTDERSQFRGSDHDGDLLRAGFQASSNLYHFGMASAGAVLGESGLMIVQPAGESFLTVPYWLLTHWPFSEAVTLPYRECLRQQDSISVAMEERH